MNKSMLFGCAVAALSVASLPAPGQAMAQGREGAAPVAAPTRQAVPQLRAPAQAERIRPKIQDRTPPVPTTSVAAGPAGAAQGANAAPPGETTNFQGWTVTCFPQPTDGSPRTCIAKMGILKSAEDRRPIMFLNIIKTGNVATLAVQTPTTVDIKAGVTLQIGRAAPRHIDYASCEPALCTATVQMDDAFAQEMASAPSALAVWTGLGIGEIRVEYALQEARNTIAFLATR